MNRLDFGRLVATLRQEMRWTQEQLAEYSGIDVSILSNIERGARKHIESEILFALANVFALTSLERREFFLGACGMDPSQIVRQHGPNSPTTVFDADAILREACDQLSTMVAPGFLVDVYGNLIAANHIFLELMDLDLNQFQGLENMPDGFLAFTFLYKMLEQQPTFTDGYNMMALTYMRSFREISLRYRATPRYAALVKEFRDVNKYPLFERYWRKAASADTDKHSMMDVFEAEHRTYGTLRYLSTSAVTLTPYGELLLTHTMPADRATALKFIEMADNVGLDVVRITPWPR